MRIGEAAKRSGMAAKTIRFYEEAGLIAPAPRTDSGYREFSRDDVRAAPVHPSRPRPGIQRRGGQAAALAVVRPGTGERGREAARAGACRAGRDEDGRARPDARRHPPPRRALPRGCPARVPDPRRACRRSACRNEVAARKPSGAHAGENQIMIRRVIRVRIGRALVWDCSGARRRDRGRGSAALVRRVPGRVRRQGLRA